MRRSQLEHAIRTACQIIGQPAVIIVGSQLILGTFRVAKLCALMEKDQNFVAALLGSKLIDRDIILTRLATVDERHRRAAERAGSWLRSLETT